MDDQGGRPSVKSTQEKDEEDDEDLPGNKLKQLGSSVISFEKNEASDGENEEDAHFGLDDGQLKRGDTFFKTAQQRNQNYNLDDYILNSEIRKLEDPNKDVTPHDFQKALFYMYGNVENFHGITVEGEDFMAHTLLKRFQLYSNFDDAKEVLKNQIVKNTNDETDD